MPEPTLQAFADHGEVGELVPADGGDAEEVLAQFEAAGIDIDALAARLQEEGKEAFAKSWKDMLETIESRARVARRARREQWPSRRLRERPPGGRSSAHFESCKDRPPARSLRATPSAASGWSPTAPASTSTSPRTGSPTRR